MTETPFFADLCWGENFDFDGITSDPGIEIDKGCRRLVLMRIAGQIRYFAGSTDPYDDEPEMEVGVFPTMDSALAFGYDYLIRRCHLSEIVADREKKRGPQ